MTQHLVIIRGNSATGKTTLARELQLAMGRGTANIGQDHFRCLVLREHDVPGGVNIGLIEQTVEYCLGVGYHVIVEGILLGDHYGEMLRDLVARHPEAAVHTYYLQLPLADTMRRHEGKPLAAEVPAEKLLDWWVLNDLLGLPGETELDAAASVDDLVQTILADIGPLQPRPDADGARFL